MHQRKRGDVVVQRVDVDGQVINPLADDRCQAAGDGQGSIAAYRATGAVRCKRKHFRNCGGQDRGDRRLCDPVNDVSNEDFHDLAGLDQIEDRVAQKMSRIAPPAITGRLPALLEM
ncbi:hypothetical protein ABLO27_00720 [Roseibium sp. SCPC15]|uniref:hypothetical protein n=1 Tax=Roseibium sp. SCP15 TaxID=3141376 RepID=UPI00333AEDFD